MDAERLRSLFDLSGRTAVVTGGTRGIGCAIAEGFAAGASVVVASRKPDACAAVEAHLKGMGAPALGVPTHLGDLDALDALVTRTVDTFGRLDVLVNNAAQRRSSSAARSRWSTSCRGAARGNGRTHPTSPASTARRRHPK